jgi:hypothetical protein
VAAVAVFGKIVGTGRWSYVDTPLPPARALAIVARALEQPDTDVFAAGVMLLAMVTGERKEIRFAPMSVRSLIARARPRCAWRSSRYAGRARA